MTCGGLKKLKKHETQSKKAPMSKYMEVTCSLHLRFTCTANLKRADILFMECGKYASCKKPDIFTVNALHA